MLERILKYIREHGMIEEQDRIIVGVSGGADSVCLLFVLLALAEELRFDLVAVHVNHMLRGEEAAKDEAYVKKLCEENGLPLEIYREDVELIAKMRKQSKEEAGREIRREAFFKTKEKYKGTKIALAHHRNDNVETVLLNLARGTGLRGLGGIYPVNGVFIRPLLCVERGEIEQFLNERGISYCTDLTNGENDYTRNRIRNNVLPLLVKEVNVQAAKHIDEAAEKLRAVEMYLEKQAEKAYEACAGKRPEDGRAEIVLRKDVFDETEEVLKTYVVKEAIGRAAGGLRDVGNRHIEAVVRLFGQQTGRTVSLPEGICASRCYEGVRIGKKEHDRTTALEKRREICLSETKETTFCGRTFSFRILQNSTDISDIPEKTYTKWFDYDIMDDNVELRTRLPGDYITIDRHGKTQKLKSYFINEKIPAELRDSLILVAKGHHVLWIVGYRMSYSCHVGSGTKRILEIRVDEGEN